MKKGGKLFVAEVLSRFADKNGDCKEFVRFISEQAGFQCLKAAKLKEFFYVMVFVKEKDAKKCPMITDEFTQTLKPCLYKKR